MSLPRRSLYEAYLQADRHELAHPGDLPAAIVADATADAIVDVAEGNACNEEAADEGYLSQHDAIYDAEVYGADEEAAAVEVAEDYSDLLDSEDSYGDETYDYEAYSGEYDVEAEGLEAEMTDAACEATEDFDCEATDCERVYGFEESTEFDYENHNAYVSGGKMIESAVETPAVVAETEAYEYEYEYGYADEYDYEGGEEEACEEDSAEMTDEEAVSGEAHAESYSSDYDYEYDYRYEYDYEQAYAEAEAEAAQEAVAEAEACKPADAASNEAAADVRDDEYGYEYDYGYEAEGTLPAESHAYEYEYDYDGYQAADAGTEVGPTEAEEAITPVASVDYRVIAAYLRDLIHNSAAYIEAATEVADLPAGESDALLTR